MTSKLFLLSSLLLASVVSLHAAFWTIGSGAVDTVARNMLAAMANGAALGATALQPAATNTLAAAAEHAATEHSVTKGGGFQAGFGANAAYGGAVGFGANAFAGGAVGDSANAAYGGAVGYNAKTSDGFAGGKDAFATSDGTLYGEPIDAIQLGSGGNYTPMTLQIYTHRLLNADGTIPVARFAATLNASNAADRAYADGLIAALPAAGCTELTGTNLVISGETYHYYAAPSAHYTLSVSNAAPRYAYSLEIVGTNGWSCTLLSGLYLRGSWTPTGTNVVVVAPGTGTVWNVYGRGL